jgi:sugar phosphate isomerase/epimerase
MLSIGLCSITFRDKSIDEVIELCQKANIKGVEWGSDVHVPPGDLDLAASARQKTESAGLSVCSYGSYYRCDRDQGDFLPLLESALALGTPVIRVWAGTKGSADADPSYRAEVVDCIRHAVETATEKGITIALEYHGGTLTDTQESAHQLLREVGKPELKLYWQPRSGGVFATDIVELEAALPHLSHVHCFHWGPGGWSDKKALSEGIEDWSIYLERIKSIGGERFVILEFVKDGTDQQLLEDAATLRTLLAE